MAEFTFYTVAMSRGQISRWALHEAGADYDQVVMDWDSRPESFKAINPMNKVPALVHRHGDHDHVVTEAAAIAHYLAETHPDKALLPDGWSDRVCVSVAARGLAGQRRTIGPWWSERGHKGFTAGAMTETNVMRSCRAASQLSDRYTDPSLFWCRRIQKPNTMPLLLVVAGTGFQPLSTSQKNMA